ncbi:hypothetical protein KAZ01_03790 [Candidatus Gracilibacteria bacterium]|nr:hypothetical protein [Candidatus Gracilibacteria bacterium]
MNTLTSSVSGRAPEIHTLESGIDRVNARIRELLEINETIIIKVAGGSASGKTTKVSEEILKYFQDQIIKISMDDYYKGKTFMKDEEQKGNDLNWDQPEALNLELLEKHINELRSGRKIKKPVYCMKTSEPIGVESVEPSKLILLEGLFTLRDELTETSELKIFVESDTTTRLTRRILR